VTRPKAPKACEAWALLLTSGAYMTRTADNPAPSLFTTEAAANLFAAGAERAVRVQVVQVPIVPPKARKRRRVKK
jgi:hypothetical protein